MSYQLCGCCRSRELPELPSREPELWIPAFTGAHLGALSERRDVSELKPGNEEFCQVARWPGESKYDGGTRTEPRWENAYRLLVKHAAEPAAEQGLLTRVLAASWLIGHTDLHQRNLGFSHPLGHEPMRVRLAPVYDASNGIGTHLDHTLAVGTARQQALSRLVPVQWMQHARECGQDEEETLAIVGETARQLPDAITSAQERAKTRDENRWQSAVDQRVDATLTYAATLAKAFEDALGTMRRKGARGLE